MNRQQFLAEFTQYLTFTTPEERDAIVSHFVSKFDEAGADGEAALLSELGTPIKSAIELKRRKESGEDLSVLCPIGKSDSCGSELSPKDIFYEDESVLQEASPVEAEDNAAEASQQEQLIVEDTPVESADLEAAPQESSVIQAPQEPSTPQAPPADISVPHREEMELSKEDEPAIADPVEALSNEPFDLSHADNTYSEDEPVCSKSHSCEKKPCTAGRVFAVIGAVLLSLIIAAVALAVAAVGVFGVCTMGNFVMAGLQNLYYLTNALLLFGGGLVIGAVGFVIIWFSVWAAISLISKLRKALCPCERKSAVMSKIWKILWIVVLLMCVIGVMCAVVGIIMGGSIGELQENQAARDALYGLNRDYIVGLLLSFVGA